MPDTWAAANLATLADLCLPGDANRWPKASNALDPAAAFADLPAADRAWIDALAAAVAALPPAARVARIAQAEREEPAPFGRFLAALYAAYYSAPGVHAVVTRLANDAPRTASPQFDRALLAQVIATQAGRGRF